MLLYELLQYQGLARCLQVSAGTNIWADADRLFAAMNPPQTGTKRPNPHDDAQASVKKAKTGGGALSQVSFLFS